MMIGPLELLVVGFPGNQFKGEILPELNRLRAAGTIRLVDLVFVSRNEAGQVNFTELSGLVGEEREMFGPFAGDMLGLMTEEDIDAVSEGIPPNSSAALLLFEHAWAIKLKEAILNANGVLLRQERIPPEVVAEVAAEMAAAQAASV
jgi:uncharacterized membrane protein